MKRSDLEQKLWSTARKCPPSDHVPYAFEKRVMAALRSRAPVDPITAWARLLLRSVAPCLALTVLLGFYAAQKPVGDAGSTTTAAQQVETTPNLEDALTAPLREEVSLAVAW
ncbi:MAG TPA: hypothetical protein VEH27_19985 [Methylomirabilota bacterium]|nr:hypothetical protein [Methylomirabilota bacterium]